MGEQRRRPSFRTTDVLSLGSFVVLGLPDGMLGTAWPSMRATFGAPVGELGLILLVTTAGSVLITAFVGPLIRRLGVPTLLAVAGALAALGYTGYAVAPGLWLVLGVSVLLGVSAGMMDGGLNTAVALTGRQRLLNLLHGAYGVGTAIGPLIVTAAILIGSWRPAYLVQVGLDLVLAGLWLRQRRRDRARADVVPDQPAPDDPHPAAAWSRRRYRGVVVVGMSVFFVYTGLEVGAGQWAASFCRGELHLSPGVTGLVVFGYWGALTAVRIGLAFLPRPIQPQAVVRWGSLISVLAAAAIWWRPDVAVAVIGFVVLGGALAGVFPALIALTPVRLGGERARNVISWQVGSAAAGGAGLSAVIGLIIGATSLAALGPAVTVLALIVVFAELTLNRLAPVRNHQAAGLAVGEAAVRGAAEEGGRALEDLADRLAGQPGLVLPVPGHLPLLAAGREGVKTGLGHGPPGPDRDHPGAIRQRLDEVGVVYVVAHLVANEPQAAERPFDGPPLRRLVPGQDAVVGVRVVAHQRGVDHGDPPDGLTDHRERVRAVPAAGALQPVDGLPHRGDGPVQRAALGRRPAGVQPVPRDPAAGRAEARVLPARGEQRAALLAVPALRHHARCYA
jgi:fucose permease